MVLKRVQNRIDTTFASSLRLGQMLSLSFPCASWEGGLTR